MGQVKGSSIKRTARKITEKYYTRISNDFTTNVDVLNDVCVINSRKMLNRIAGYVTRLYNRINRGDHVKGVFIKAHEEEKARNEAVIPTEGVMDVERVEVDSVTFSMINEYNIQGEYVSIDL